MLFGRADFGMNKLLEMCTVTRCQRGVAGPGMQLRVEYELTVYKKIYIWNLWGNKAHAIATLKLSEGTRIIIGDEYFRSGKLRADRATVVKISGIRNMKVKYQKGFSKHRSDFIYECGHTVKPVYKFDLDFESCSDGIHFFINLDDARRY